MKYWLEDCCWSWHGGQLNMTNTLKDSWTWSIGWWTAADHDIEDNCTWRTPSRTAEHKVLEILIRGLLLIVTRRTTEHDDWRALPGVRLNMTSPTWMTTEHDELYLEDGWTWRTLSGGRLNMTALPGGRLNMLSAGWWTVSVCVLLQQPKL